MAYRESPKPIIVFAGPGAIEKVLRHVVQGQQVAIVSSGSRLAEIFDLNTERLEALAARILAGPIRDRDTVLQRIEAHGWPMQRFWLLLRAEQIYGKAAVTPVTVAPRQRSRIPWGAYLFATFLWVAGLATGLIVAGVL